VIALILIGVPAVLYWQDLQYMPARQDFDRRGRDRFTRRG
jgi:hypothetical protein